jgi:asparagine synthase (glutamine-hydrolysing)
MKNFNEGLSANAPEGAEKYEDFLKRIEGTNILPTGEGEWSPEELRQTFEDVFKEYGLEALAKNNGKIFTTLSGGLDSSLALALLRKNFPNDEIVTFSMGGSTEHPDILHAHLAAQKFGSNHNEFIPTADETQEALAEYKEKFQADLNGATETGDFDVYLLYKYISRFHPDTLLVHDGIDELMGGYWNHRKEVAEEGGEKITEEERRKIFEGYWKDLIPKHLNPLIGTSSNFDINLLFPYLDPKIIEVASHIPLNDRTSVETSKKPTRKLAEELGVPKEILERQKRGQIGMLDRK